MIRLGALLALLILLPACSLTYIQVRERNDNDLTGGQQRGGQLSNDSEQTDSQEQHQPPRTITKCTYK